MGIYSPSSVWGLAPDYNMHRGQILDESRLSPTPTVGWTRDAPYWNGGKHGVQDGSIHYEIQKFLETQPQKRASIMNITAAVPRAADHPDHYLRELKKQGICERI